PEPGDNVLHIYFRDGKRPDRITTILNGVGATTSIEYGRGGLDSAGAATCQYPHVCAGRQVDVVSGYTSSEGQVAAGQGDSTHFSMLYAGSTADALGVGWLGFAGVQRRNDRTHVTETKNF